MSTLVRCPCPLRLGVALAALWLGVTGCGAPQAPADRPAPTRATAPRRAGSATPTARAEDAPAASCPVPPCARTDGRPAAPLDRATPAGLAAQEPVAFPPATFAPLHERTAQPGDGQWQAYGPAGPSGRPALARATIHPNAYKRYVFAIVIALDLSRLELALVPGQEEPKSAAVPAERRTGLVPAADHGSLVAVFNGGFMARHGKHGMRIGDDLFLPPQDDTCTIAFVRDGRLRVGSWPALRGDDASFAAYRQAPPCLVERGVVHPELPTEHGNRRWGAAEDGKRDVRRSALCLDPSGRVAMYGFGDYITATELAQALRQAGGHDCAELDINWSYTRFFLVDSSTSPPTLGESLVEKLEYSKQSYISKPYYKDFFYVKWRGGRR